MNTGILLIQKQSNNTIHAKSQTLDKVAVGEKE